MSFYFVTVLVTFSMKWSIHCLCDVWYRLFLPRDCAQTAARGHKNNIYVRLYVRCMHSDKTDESTIYIFILQISLSSFLTSCSSSCSERSSTYTIFTVTPTTTLVTHWSKNFVQTLFIINVSSFPRICTYISDWTVSTVCWHSTPVYIARRLYCTTI